MSPLAAALVANLDADVEFPAFSVASFATVLYVIGQDDGPAPIPEARVEAALEDQLAAGLVERIWCRGMPRYRALGLDARGIIGPGDEGR